MLVARIDADDNVTECDDLFLPDRPTTPRA